MKKIRFRWVFLGVILIPTLANSIYWTYSDWIQPRKAAKLAECVRKEFRQAMVEKLVVEERDTRVAELCGRYAPSQALVFRKSGPHFLVLKDSTRGFVAVWQSRAANGEQFMALTSYLYYGPTFSVNDL